MYRLVCLYTHGSGDNHLIHNLLTYMGITLPKSLEIPFVVKPVQDSSGPVFL